MHYYIPRAYNIYIQNFRSHISIRERERYKDKDHIQHLLFFTICELYKIFWI